MNSLWRVCQEDAGPVKALALEAKVPEIVASLLHARGVATAQDASRFLAPDVSALHDPFALRGAGEAAEVLVWAARRGRRVVVFGDYDVDGVTAVAQLRAALLRAGADAVAFLPHRIRDGYGLKPETVTRVMRELSPGVIVTVDCGITAIEGVACARAQGVEVVVTDHHLVPQVLPEGAIVVNPRQPGCLYPDKELGDSGTRAWLRREGGDLDCVWWSREALEPSARHGEALEIQYRIRRGRRGVPQIEILGARGSGPEDVRMLADSSADAKPVDAMALT